MKTKTRLSQINSSKNDTNVGEATKKGKSSAFITTLVFLTLMKM